MSLPGNIFGGKHLHFDDIVGGRYFKLAYWLTGNLNN